MIETCKNCNGVGLVSTGGDRLNLNHGDKVVCKECAGSGKVSTVDNSTENESPKAEGAAPTSDTGEDSGTQSESSGDVAPAVGDACLMDDDAPGVLSKDDQGNWMCVPKPPEA